MEDDYKPRRGSCDICGTVYDKEVYESHVDAPFDAGYFSRDCPKCKWSPFDSHKIKQTLENAVVTVSFYPGPNGRINFGTNVAELHEEIMILLKEKFGRRKKKNE